MLSLVVDGHIGRACRLGKLFRFIPGNVSEDELVPISGRATNDVMPFGPVLLVR